MSKNFIIHKSDNWDIRQHKKKLRSIHKRKNAHYLKNTPASDTSNLKFFYINDIQRFCEINFTKSWGADRNIITLTEDVSLHNNTNKVLKTLLNILHFAQYADRRKIPSIIIKGDISFGALYLIDNICWEIGRHRHWQIQFLNLREPEIEIVSKLKTFQSHTYNSDKAYMINEVVEINRLEDKITNQQYKVRAKEITDMLNVALKECTNNPEYELSFYGYKAIQSTIGEHFDNILQHAPNANAGSLCGFYNKEKKEVEILIFNFGASIAETLNNSELPIQIKREIDTIIEKHTEQKIFSSNSFTAENALTLLALQEGISSRLIYDESRGHGLMDFIENCFLLNIGTRIVIVSGKTVIKLNSKYQPEQKRVLNRLRRIIALNTENDLFIKPDEDCVQNLKYYFPGVIIETTIPLE